MAPAWLDSLSEDWPSQAGSEASPSALPPLKPSENNKTPNGKGAGSRIPLPVSRIRPSSAGTEKSGGVLSERSTNDVNLPLSSQRRPTPKRSREFKPSELSRQPSRALSASTNGSVIHNTVQHKSIKSSPLKNVGSTPEWKRRLVYGDVAYGEQRDLFCSAAAGLENMFKPPTPQDTSLADQSPRHESTLPSSPPLFRRADVTTGEEEEEESDGRSQMDPSPSPSPRIRPPQVTYKLADDSLDQSKLSEFSAPHDSHPQEPTEPTVKESVPTADTSVTGLAPPNDASRKTSGHSVIRNEDFSPIVLTLMRPKGEDGDAEPFAPTELPIDQLQNRLEKLRIDQMLLDSQGELQFDADETQDEPENDKVDTTEDYARKGGFLNLQRGGRSGDGSFRYRGLSPGMRVDTSEMFPEESLQASTPKQFPSVRTYSPGQGTMRYGSQSPPPPRAPHPSPDKRATNGTNSTSPLKLFGPYDTFTNQTLLRRISQFEDQMSGSSRQSLSGAYSGDASRLTEKPRPHTAPVGYLSVPAQQTAGSSRSVSQFGAGDLEGYQFDQEISIRRDDEESQFYDEGDFDGLSGFEESVLRFANVTGSPGQEESMFIPRKRAKSATTTDSSSKHTREVSFGSEGSVQRGNVRFPLDDSLLLGTPHRRDTGSEGKRPMTSPSKDPTPKRRRTLHNSDIAYGREERFQALEPVHESHALMQSMMGKKRKDARPGSMQQRAHPSVLANRHILRPRTPTPSSRSSMQRDDYFPEDYLLEEPPTRRSPTRASQLTTSGNDRNGTLDTDRKPSIRTQDFLDEAGKIMAMIRNGAKAPSGLTSVEESDAEFGEPSPVFDEDSYEESTREPLSRPPSREGKPVQRAPQRQENPDILDYLKKYQELSDMGDVISSSLRSMDQAQDAIRVAQEVERQIEERSRERANTEDLQYLGGDETISDPPNIRISANPNRPMDSIDADDYPTHSSGASTTRTIHTGSSRNSESRKTIMPQSVSHLIPDQVGSMYLDRQQNIWIKRKGESVRPRSAHLHSHVLPSEDSEDDPFASIPDLSVDLTKEMQHLRIVTAQKEAEANEVDWSLSPPGSAGSFGTPRNPPGKGFVTLSPDGTLPKDIAAQARTEFTKLGSKLHDGEVEHEIQLDEDRITDSSPSRRRMTISFSSPIASIIQDVAAEDIDSLEDDEGSFIDSQFVLEESKRSKYQSLTKAARRNLLQPRPCTAPARGPSRQFSLRGQSFVPRPVSRIDERDEDSVVDNAEERQVSIIADNSALSHVSHENQERSLSFLIKTPGKTRNGGLYPDAGAFITHHVGNLSLSPMSEFTLNHNEKSFGFEVSYIVDDQRLVTGDGSKKVMSMTVRDLVDRLTEIEPFEPYWEDFTELDVSERRLSSLHMLDEFCGRLVSLDASDNSIGHLDGVPASVRQLKITNNMITELTSWDHLTNLQYVDLSNNDLTSLSALKNLVHLRSLKADNNKLTSLDGLNQHDGLLSLRARNNFIEVADFDGTKLHRLTELDLSGNKVKELLNVGQLSSLETLKLPRNKLLAFTAEDAQGLDGLRYLDLSDNEIAELDIGRLPAVRLLHADRNRITNITGFTKARHLDSLSLREQRGDGQLDLSFLSSAYEVRKLFLSGNYIGAFEPKVDFLNLQLLELANCGLHRLPEGLGLLMPNLRSLNLNFNAIADLSPIRFVPRLKKLLAAGNRLADSTSVTELLTDFPHLTQLDLRDNPITQGFYPPVQVMVPADRGNFTDPFVLPEADVQRDEVFSKRLDEATRLRRRLYQVIFVGCCKRLKLLDGLPVKRQLMLARDPAFQALVQEGLLPSDSAGVPASPAAKSPAKTPAKTPVKTPAKTPAKTPTKSSTKPPPSRSSFKAPAEAPARSSPTIRVTAPANEPSQSPAPKSAVSSRWNAEDSFA